MPSGKDRQPKNEKLADENPDIKRLRDKRHECDVEIGKINARIANCRFLNFYRRERIIHNAEIEIRSWTAQKEWIDQQIEERLRVHTPASPDGGQGQNPAVPAVTTSVVNPAVTPSGTPPPKKSSRNPQNEELGIVAARYTEELKRMARFARGKRKFDEQDARKQFPELSFWKALDNSNISETSRKEMFLDAQQSFGTKDGRIKIIAELMGVADTTAYDYYKDRPGAPQRQRK